ncbi:uncharacterized protein B0P05DRAFT_535425 [Gilbertella persicaria]|uniref:uncharacterized protein n=1 Tax=Gilbertella persicaria TaxID=101096 RepID=UPI00221FFD1E|nr:uncharacterized protein B0P05DRAFT_535425 [Gilbertella persicaria]KAI8084399.1 hypothetical protein B0P05DRAFT_535425 [Gilbertella persicaria]
MNKINSQNATLNHNNKDFSPPPVLSVSISSDSNSPIKEQFIMKVDQQQQQQQQQQQHTSQHTKLPTPITPTQDFSSLFGQFSLKTVPSSPYENPKTFTCLECGQTFNRAHNLKSHKATHSATKPFQCNDCEKQFLRLHDLKRHQKLHTGERPYHCPVCKRSFSRLDALNRHRKTEGGSACLRTSHHKNNHSPSMLIPSMITQWQVNTKLPPPFQTNNASSPPSLLSSSSSTSPPPPTLPSSPPSSLTSLPPLILPFNHNHDQDEIEALRQRIHDLEIENRVLRSLLCNKDDDESSKPKRQRSP